PEESDSASLDRIIELLILSGFSPEHAINMCIPPAWECCDFSTEGHRGNVEAFFEYQSFLMKPWDGPAALVFTDGDTIGAHLDRNGLRPLRYLFTEDGILILGSEIGVVNLKEKTIKEKGRLGPGETVSIDFKRGKLRYTDEILRELAKQKPYQEWIDNYLLRLKKGDGTISEPHPEIMRRQIAFGYTSEEIQTSIKVMTGKAKEMTYSMGDDTPLPPLSEKPQLLFRYFKQRFSQTTNPPIDPIRERMVTSLKMNIGYKRNFLMETPEHARRLQIDSPLLLESTIKEIEEQKIFKIERIPITFPKANSNSLLPIAVRELQKKVVTSVKNGAEIILLSDIDITKERGAIPGLLAVSASFKTLQREGIANRVSLIMETGEARDIHHMACLIGYGASAIYPYLVFQTIKEMCDKGALDVPYEIAVLNYKKAIEDGLLNVIARMGISTLNSYYGAQLFDTVCLNKDFVDEYFTGTPVSIESDGMAEIEESLLKRHVLGFDATEPSLDYGGHLRHRKEGEWHAWSVSSVVALSKFIRDGDYKTYKEFSRIANERPVFIRHLLGYKTGKPITLEEVESEEHILKRFFSGAMSVGALSPEAHETIAEACNRLGIKSNSGEGGEDPVRYETIKNSAIKQIASGRFGVTPVYLASATDLEIKIAQGAKPGEGGHLPANKVTEYIAMLRHCRPNSILISPAPHHDIYSIEDLAQLINDLKEANPDAKICVKLVSETGVGTVASGVAKAYGDIVQISGCEGGTGASPLSSIKNAGNYWETGLAETQRVLMENGLRHKVRVRVDGGLRTGKDIIIAALIGAEEFGFGTATMIATGCIMARQCHLNTCPTGIATQDERLREKFRGKVEGVMSYFKAVAQEVREILTEMGYGRLDEIIGRTELLTEVLPEGNKGARRIKLNKLFNGYPKGQPRRCTIEKNDNPVLSMNDKLLNDLLPYIQSAESVEKEYEIRNIHRSIPIKLNYHISHRYKDEGLPPDTIKLTFRGTAGQSFGAFNHKGLSLRLIGDANDYVGKGMFGGRIIIRPSDIKETHKHVIMGNTVLYGATGGEFYGAGRAGERFAVRNSGATAVVEGAGHHLCEYMTRGTVVVLGKVGYNVGAGMTGGVIYIFDENDKIKNRLDNSNVKALGLEEEQDMQNLKSLIENHYRYAGSPRAGEILHSFDSLLKHFYKVVPIGFSLI
ncbi:MAG: glutamate synthase large subunit, partial [Nitrospirota bacterium]|nr:glutamate synthase large subunit [Nitrospirota bacterium]